MVDYIRRGISIVYTHVVHFFSKGVRIGCSTVIYYKSPICNHSRLGGVYIGSNCIIGSSPYTYHSGMPFYTTILNDGDNSSVEIGDNCRLNSVYIHAKSKIIIGNNCVMASGINIVDTNGHEVYSSDRTKGKDEAKAISIGNNVWIGVNAIILKGTQIGDNSIVAAGSVVKGVFPSNSLISGNPATIVKRLEI